MSFRETMADHSTKLNGSEAGRVPGVVYWRVEGSLLEVSALRSVGFFNWNSQSFLERWVRRAGMLVMALLRVPAYFTSRKFSTRLLYTVLRGITRGRLDLLGEEYFQYELKPKMRRESAEKLIEAVRNGERIILVGQLLEQILRPMAEYFNAEGFIANRLEFRDGVATGRLGDPVIRPRGPFAWLASGSMDGRVAESKLSVQLGWRNGLPNLVSATQAAARPAPPAGRPVDLPSGTPRVERLSVRETLAGKHILLIGVTGFIGKVWMVDLLEKIPEIGKITLLIRRNRTTTAQRRFEKIVEESPTLDGLEKQYGARLGEFLRQKIDVVEGDVSVSGLALEASVCTRLQHSLDLVVNSAGLTDFNPDLRDAISSNVESAEHLLNFIRSSDHAALMHLSTCYVVGMRDGRVTENLHDHYSPANVRNFPLRGRH